MLQKLFSYPRKKRFFPHDQFKSSRVFIRLYQRNQLFVQTVSFQKKKRWFKAPIGSIGFVVFIDFQHFNQFIHRCAGMVFPIGFSFRTQYLDSLRPGVVQCQKGHDRFNLGRTGADVQQPIIVRILLIVRFKHILYLYQFFIILGIRDPTPDKFYGNLRPYGLDAPGITGQMILLCLHFPGEEYNHPIHRVVPKDMKDGPIVISPNRIRIPCRSK